MEVKDDQPNQDGPIVAKFSTGGTVSGRGIFMKFAPEQKRLMMKTLLYVALFANLVLVGYASHWEFGEPWMAAVAAVVAAACWPLRSRRWADALGGLALAVAILVVSSHILGYNPDAFAWLTIPSVVAIGCLLWQERHPESRILGRDSEGHRWEGTMKQMSPNVRLVVTALLITSAVALPLLSGYVSVEFGELWMAAVGIIVAAGFWLLRPWRWAKALAGLTLGLALFVAVSHATGANPQVANWTCLPFSVLVASSYVLLGDNKRRRNPQQRDEVRSPHLNKVGL